MSIRKHDAYEVEPPALEPVVVETMHPQPAAEKQAQPVTEKQTIPRVDRDAIRQNVDAWIASSESTPLEQGKRYTLTLSIGLDSGFTSTPEVK